jgi:peptide deformylase
MRLKIVTVGEPVLREACAKISKKQIQHTNIQNLIEYMRETMRDAPGVGLAAPQVGVSMQIAVIEDKAEYHRGLSASEMAERKRKPVLFHVIVNPVLELLSEPDTVFFEGCLSLPGFTAIVPRARAVRVTYLDHKGEPRIIKASGWYARILQHEIDHLHGTLYIDRMNSRSFCSLDNYNRHWKGKPVRNAVKQFSDAKLL